MTSAPSPSVTQALKRAAEESLVPPEENSDSTKKRRVMTTAEHAGGAEDKVVVEDKEDIEEEEEEASETEGEYYEPQRPPQWLVRAARDLREFDPHFSFNVLLSFGHNGKGMAEFKVQCADCPATLYDHYRGQRELEKHVQSKEHREQINARLKTCKART